jgi:protein-S-isoprenylcysteine O-methyltransferase Ste14
MTDAAATPDGATQGIAALRAWAAYITPALFAIGLVVNGTALALWSVRGTPLHWYAAAFVAANLAWLAAEAPITLSRPSAPPTEVATLVTYGLVRFATVGAALLGPVPWHRATPWLVLPPLVFAAGIALRLWAMRILGRFYSHHVIRRADHVIVTDGPYRVLRHPAYAGMLLAHLGLVLFFANPVSVLMLLALGGVLGWRIRVEERALLALPAYRDYARRRPRLVPGLW